MAEVFLGIAVILFLLGAFVNYPLTAPREPLGNLLVALGLAFFAASFLAPLVTD